MKPWSIGSLVGVAPAARAVSTSESTSSRLSREMAMIAVVLVAGSAISLLMKVPEERLDQQHQHDGVADDGDEAFSSVNCGLIGKPSLLKNSLDCRGR